MMKYTNVTQNPDGTYNIHYEEHGVQSGGLRCGCDAQAL